MAIKDFKVRIIEAARAQGVKAGEPVTLDVASAVARSLNGLRHSAEHKADFSALCGKYLTGPSLADMCGARLEAPKVKGF